MTDIEELIERAQLANEQGDMRAAIDALIGAVRLLAKPTHAGKKARRDTYTNPANRDSGGA